MEGGLCAEFNKDHEFGGSYEAFVKYVTFQLFFYPCRIVNPGDCTVEYQGIQHVTNNTSFIASEYFRDYFLEFFFVESIPDTANLQKPLRRHLHR